MSDYCRPEDLMVDRSTPLPAATDRGPYITSASAYMDTRLAVAFSTPLSLDPTKPGAETDIALLRTICAHLATGGLLLAISAGSERYQVHAYGKLLIDRGEQMLAQLLDGTLDLVTIPRLPSASDTRPGGPLIGHGTSINMTDAYYQNYEPYGPMPRMYAPGPADTWPEGIR